MKRLAIMTSILVVIGILGLTMKPACAFNIDLTAGTTGTLLAGQSFNETRAVDVKVVLAVGLQVQSMSLQEFNIVTGTGTVGARIYDSSTQALIAEADQTVGQGFNQNVTIPLSATLFSGKTYRVGFYIDTPTHDQGSGTMFDPDPPLTGITLYTEPTGSLQIIEVYSITSDSFPTSVNRFMPLITFEANPVPLPSTVLMLGSGLLGLAGWRRLRKS